ncbi:MAG: ATP-binding protein [Deltaproteobacteria bacterium]|nr:ATP-binding protein [Deltaproteobacteria bacterium]
MENATLNKLLDAKRPPYFAPDTPCVDCGENGDSRHRHNFIILCEGCDSARSKAVWLKGALDRAGISERHRGADLDDMNCPNLKYSANIASLKEYVKIFDQEKVKGENRVLLGPMGTGKTMAAYAIAEHAVRKGKAVMCSTFTGLMISLKETYGKGGGTMMEAMKKFSDPILLVVDDVRAGVSDHERDLFHEIINTRYEGMLSTIITANLNRSTLKEAIGNPCYDRIQQDGEIILLDSTSFRGS